MNNSKEVNFQIDGNKINGKTAIEWLFDSCSKEDYQSNLSIDNKNYEELLKQLKKVNKRIEGLEKLLIDIFCLKRGK